MGAAARPTLCIAVRDARHQLYRELTRPARVPMLAGRGALMTSKQLDAFFDGWNRHDVDALMRFMADDCVFETSAGAEACGTRHTGRERVRAAFDRVFVVYPDARFAHTRHFIAGDRGLSEWLFTGTTDEGKKTEVNGCDVFTFDGDKIAVKSAFFKNRTA
jgi:ketosteroid isomerase-like protein